MPRTVIQEICEGIEGLDSLEELKAVYESYRSRSQELRDVGDFKAKLKFKKGQRVSFESKGDKWEGTIIKKNEKRARVSVPNPDGRGFSLQWDVPYTMLKAVD